MNLRWINDMGPHHLPSLGAVELTSDLFEFPKAIYAK